VLAPWQAICVNDAERNLSTHRSPFAAAGGKRRSAHPTASLETKMPSDRQRKANNALGICFISLMFLAETVVAHQLHPIPASPLIWSVLGAVALCSLIYYLRFKGR
jgi:hypothetical protein